MWEGFAVGVANPKTIVFFAAVLPQFVDQGLGHVAVQMLWLGLVFNVIAVASDSVWGLIAATTRSRFARSPQRLALVGGAGGLAMIGLGVTSPRQAARTEARRTGLWGTHPAWGR